MEAFLGLVWLGLVKFLWWLWEGVTVTNLILVGIYWEVGTTANVLHSLHVDGTLRSASERRER